MGLGREDLKKGPDRGEEYPLLRSRKKCLIDFRGDSSSRQGWREYPGARHEGSRCEGVEKGLSGNYT